MSETRSDARMVTLDASGWEQPPPGVVWRTAHVLLTKESDGGVSAVVLNLPGCASQGETIESALANVREAIVGVLAVYAESGQPVPWRNSREDPIPPFSEQRYVRVDEDTTNRGA